MVRPLLHFSPDPAPSPSGITGSAGGEDRQHPGDEGEREDEQHPREHLLLA